MPSNLAYVFPCLHMFHLHLQKSSCRQCLNAWSLSMLWLCIKSQYHMIYVYIYIGQCHFDQKHSDQVGTLSFCQSLDRTRAWETTICRIEPPSINQNIHPIQATLYYNKIWVEWSGVHAYTTASVKCKALMNQIPCLLPLAPYRP